METIKTIHAMSKETDDLERKLRRDAIGVPDDEQTPIKEADIAAIQSDAFAAGERKGRIAGLREAADLCSGDSHIEEGIRAEADRLEREEKVK